MLFPTQFTVGVLDSVFRLPCPPLGSLCHCALNSLHLSPSWGSDVRPFQISVLSILYICLPAQHQISIYCLSPIVWGLRWYNLLVVGFIFQCLVLLEPSLCHKKKCRERCELVSQLIWPLSQTFCQVCLMVCPPDCVQALHSFGGGRAQLVPQLVSQCAPYRPAYAINCRHTVLE